MFVRLRNVFVAVVLLSGLSLGDEPPAASLKTKAAPPVSLLGRLPLNGVGEMLQTATELRKAGESMERFGESLERVSAVVEKTASSTSSNLAAIGGEFDPFGFKTAFETIQQQNEIIQAQHQMIIALQQQEIQRLQKASTPKKRRARRSRKASTSAE